VLNHWSTSLWRHMGEWRFSSIILDLGTRWRWAVGFTFSQFLPKGKGPQYPLDRKLDAVEYREMSCPCQELNPCLPSLSYTGSSSHGEMVIFSPITFVRLS
jgi:hypothetical protein